MDTGVTGAVASEVGPHGEDSLIRLGKEATEIALGVHVGVEDGERAMGDVLDLLLPSSRVTPLQNHSPARPNLHNT